MKNKKYRYKKLILKISIGLLFSLVILAFIVYIIDDKECSDFVKKSSIEMGYHDLDINISAPVIARQEILINAPIEEVWNRLTSIKNWNKWQSRISDIKIDSLPKKNISFDWTSDGISFHSIIHTNNLYEKFGWIGTTWGAQAIHNWYFRKEGNNTRVIVEESLQGFLVYLFSDYFQNNLNIGMQKNLDELKKSCEQ